METLEPRLALSAAGLVLSEFMASNDTTLADGDGVYSDWIEVYNPTDTSVDLSDYLLTDDPGHLNKWAFPSLSLAAGEYLVVFASSPDDGAGGVLDDYRDAGGHYHTNFSLAAGGEYLALAYEDPVTHVVSIEHEYAPEYPAQYTDLSFGVSVTLESYVEAGSPVSYLVPTDGALGETWSGAGFDDSGWTSRIDLVPTTVLITELNVGSPHWIEIQNVAAQTVDTTGWRVAFNDSDNLDIDEVHSFVWDFSNSLDPGQVLATNENENGLGSIAWSQDGPGWAMLLDDAGQVRDFVVWGYSERELATFGATVNGFEIGPSDVPWIGEAVPGATFDPILRRSGSADYDVREDFAFGSASNPAAQNPGITLPFTAGSTIPVRLGVGYETNPIGGSVGGDVTNLALGGAASQSSISAGYTPDQAIDGSYDNFTHTQAGQELPSWWQVDLGDMFVLEQVTLFNRAGCCQSRLRDITVEVLDDNQAVVFTSELLNPENAGYFYPNGPATMELDLVTLHGGVPVVGQTVRVTRTPDPDLSGTDGLGNNDEADVLSLGEVEILGRDLLGFEQAYQTDLYDEMFGENGTVYLRVPFEVTNDPAALEQLTLWMQYDDGFIAYLNGTEIARRNAPSTPAFNSVATAEHDDVLALQFEEFDVSSYLHHLQVGENVLAIQGLNVAGDDEDFLIVPELVGVSTTTAVRYFDSPTPGAANQEGILGFVADTQFSVDRGFFDTPFQLSITSATPDAEIYYTTDGLPPSPATSRIYTGPMQIDETTVLRAIAFKEGYLPTNVDTQTYLFVNDVIQQDYQATLEAGFPTSWGGTFPDYGMDPDVIGTFDANGNPLGDDRYGGAYADTIADDLLSIPTMSIVMDIDDLFGPSGIYTNATGHGDAWERATSIEFIQPDGSQGFQVDAGLRIQGGYFRSPGATPKHSFRLLFRDEYGPTKLEFPLFGESAGAVDVFDTIVLRAGANDGYSWNAARYTEQYIRDEFGRSLQLAAGDPSAHGNFVHLYLNGIYWGLYNPVERPDNDFSASYISGDEENWDALHVVEATQGDFVAWDAMLAKARQARSSLNDYMELQGLHLDGSPDASRAPLLDVQNYADYIAINVWGGNWDWPWKNWWAGRDRDPETTTGFKFYNWDFENTMGNNRGRSPLDATTLDQDFRGDRNAGQPHRDLRSNQEYRMLFADRVHGFFFNGGILTPDALIARYQDLADEVEHAMVGESARWGDQHYSTPLTVANWMTERDWILNTYLPQRSAIVLNELRSYNLYPDTVAPAFSQHGGQLAAGEELTISAPAGTIYYTLDGSDPREIGGALRVAAFEYTGTPLELASAATVRARVLNGGEWSALNQADFIVAVPASELNLRITEVNYNPHAANLVPGLGEMDVDNDQFEFVELQNVSNESIDLSGVRFVEVADGANNEGIVFTFHPHTLAAGQRVLVVRDQAAFESRYGTSLPVAGEYDGKLDNGGELLTLRASDNQTIQQFEYDDSGAWPGRPDGKGATLEVIDPAGDYNRADNWQSSNEFGGSPGTVGTGPVFDVVLNEVLSHSNGELLDQLEIYNTTDASIDLEGWHLSDTSTDYLRYTFGAGAVIGAGEYLTLDQNQFGFALDGQFGDDLWLLQGDPNQAGKPLRFADHQDFFATDTDLTLGLWPDGDPSGTLFPMAFPTLGNSNSGPVFGDLLITEIHYDPPTVPLAEQANISQGELEFVELFNNRDHGVNISHWSVDGLGFAFPAGTSVASGEVILVVPFDPLAEPAKTAAFRTVLGAESDVRLFGPATGRLDNAGESVTLLKPEDAVFLAAGGDVLVDTVSYDELAPWPSTGNGAGLSLTRTARTDFAPLASSWIASGASPGQVTFGSLAEGDYDRNGLVDSTDRGMWAAWFGGTATPSGNLNLPAADGNADGVVDAADFTVWRDHLGESVTAPVVVTTEVVIAGRSDSESLSPIRTLPAAWSSPSLSQAARLTPRSVAPDLPHGPLRLAPPRVGDPRVAAAVDRAFVALDGGALDGGALDGGALVDGEPAGRARHDVRNSRLQRLESDHAQPRRLVRDRALQEWFRDEVEPLS